MIRDLFVLLLFVFALQLSFARGEDLVTRDGTVYHDYKVLSHDAGYLTIMDSDGGGKIPLSNLPDDLQKKYGYNKQQADAAVQATIAQDRLDRQALTKEEASQAATPAQALSQVEISPVSANTSVLSVPAPAPATISAPSPPTNTQPSSTRRTTTQVTPKDIAGLKMKISELRDEMSKVKMGDTDLVINSDPYIQRLSADMHQLAVMRNQLDQMEIDLPRKTLSWDDVSRIHDQIVDLEDDITRQTPDSTSDDVRVQVNSSDKIEEDNEEISELRQTLESSPKDPVRLSPDDVAKIRQQMDDLKSELEKLAARTSEDATVAESEQRQIHADTEQYSMLQDKLTAAGNP